MDRESCGLDAPKCATLVNPAKNSSNILKSFILKHNDNDDNAQNRYC